MRAYIHGVFRSTVLSASIRKSAHHMFLHKHIHTNTQMRGEFHFWGWNSILRLNPSLFQVSYSLCDAQKVSAWKNATNGRPINLSNARIKVRVCVCVCLYVRIHLYMILHSPARKHHVSSFMLAPTHKCGTCKRCDVPLSVT